MTTKTLYGQKKNMTVAYLGEKRIPVTRIFLPALTVTQVKDAKVQVALGTKRLANKPLSGHIKKANLKSAPQYVREIPAGEGEVKVGDAIQGIEAVEAGDIVSIQGKTKGKGFAGGMKRWGFHGGSRTHGQSDRARHPGSIGQTTTPGRVYKGKHMAGHLGATTQTVKSLTVVGVDKDNQVIWVSGSVPGTKDALLTLTVTGHKELPRLAAEAAPAPQAKEEPKPEEGSQG